jgi:NADH-quinone oxidoreductase E subunit
MISERVRLEIEETLKRYPTKRAALVMALHAIRRENTFFTQDDFIDVADILDMSPTDVASIADFYDMFLAEKPAKCRIAVCTSVSCMLRGSDKIVEYIKKRLGVDFNECTSDGLFCIHEAECLGACDKAPVIAVNDEHVGPITTDELDALIAGWRRGNPPPEGGPA